PAVNTGPISAANSRTGSHIALQGLETWFPFLSHVSCSLLLFHKSGRPCHFLGKRGERVIINLHLPPQTGFLELLLHPRPDEDAEEEHEGHMAQDTPNKQVFERHW